MWGKLFSVLFSSVSSYFSWLKIGGIALGLAYVGYLKYEAVQQDLTIEKYSSAVLEWKQQNKVLKSNLAQTVANTKVLQQQADTRKAQLAGYFQQLKKLNVALEKANNHVDDLRKLYSKHSLSNLLKKKPGLLERRINSATAKLFSHAEAATTTR